jgi:DNA-binding GntR family transcriptional regulator
VARTAPVSRSVLSDQVKDRLLRGILTGHYPPGSRIVETRVAQELGTSQAPVREALRDLEALGVVEIAAYRGARVRRPTRSELLEAFIIRAELESLAARLALPRITDADLEELQGYIDEMHRAVRDGDAHAEALADAQFHGRVVQISANDTLGRVWRHLEPFSRTYITIFIPGADQARIADLHVPILTALRGRDPLLASDALRRHFEDVGGMLGSLWQDTDPSSTAAPAEAGRAGLGRRLRRRQPRTQARTARPRRTRTST